MAGRGWIEGVDPRTYLRSHRERGPKSYRYTTEDLAELFKVTRETIYKWTAQGRLDPADITSVIALYVERGRKRTRRAKGRTA